MEKRYPEKVSKTRKNPINAAKLLSKFMAKLQHGAQQQNGLTATSPSLIAFSLVADSNIIHL